MKSTHKPPLKWAGGKRWLISHLAPLFEKHQSCRLVEPFVGGMAVALSLRPQQALLNDANPHLINFYKQLQSGFIVKSDLKNDRNFFFEKRARFNELIKQNKTNSKESAEIFYYMNRTAFNGLCRFNSSGEYNVPFGKYVKINYTKDFSSYVPVLKSWRFSCGDFEKLNVKEDDFIYIDPPYDVEFTKYSKEGFTWNDQERLVDWLSAYSCPIVASNQATERILKLYKKAGFTVRTLPAPRKISCTGDRTHALEMLATKNL